MKRRAGGRDRGLAGAREAVTPVGPAVQDLRAVAGLRKPSDAATGAEREAQGVALGQAWETSVAPRPQQCAKVLSRWAPGWLVGGEEADGPADHGAVERWCKRPKGHERRRHGRRQAGMRLVPPGPTRMVARAAHGPHPGPLTVDDLEPYRHSRRPASQPEALERGKSMRQARSAGNALWCSPSLKNGIVTRPSL